MRQKTHQYLREWSIWIVGISGTIYWMNRGSWIWTILLIYCVVSDVNYVSPNRFKKVKQGWAFIWQSFLSKDFFEMALGDFFEIRHQMSKQGKPQWLINTYSVFFLSEALISFFIIKFSDLWKPRKKTE